MNGILLFIEDELSRATNTVLCVMREPQVVANFLIKINSKEVKDLFGAMVLT